MDRVSWDTEKRLVDYNTENNKCIIMSNEYTIDKVYIELRASSKIT